MVQQFINLVCSLHIHEIKVAEVGVRDGSSTKEYMPHVKALNGHIWAVDWFKGNPYRTNLHAENQDKTDEQWYNTFLGSIQNDITNMTILRECSSSASEKIPDRSLDICFIDGDHRYWQVMSDIELYLPKVKIGGIFCGHDLSGRGKKNEFTAKDMYKYVVYNGEHISVKQAVYDWFGENYENMGDDMWKIIVTGQESLN